MPPVRAFLAVDVASTARAALTALQNELQPSGGSWRWVPPENLHLTVRFVGAVEPAALDALSATLRRAVDGCRPFRYRLSGGGAFPSSRRARVVWVGVSPVPDELTHLHGVVEHAVREHGFAAEARGFNPHLTVARVKVPDESVALLIKTLRGSELGETAVSELVLFESELSSGGARYRAVHRFRLNGPSDSGGPVEKQLV